ncbi:hypothetical protein [Rhodococcus koreensis]|uniref:hypothetical protein n=1 Tax=Rhodococcus koreensis TaxID=99653 RepID=UPI00366BA53F
MTTKAQAIADDVERLARSGMSRNKIAEKLGVAQGTVTKAARLRGVEFDRAQTIEATEARIYDAKASRADLALRWLALAHRALDGANQALTDGEAGDFRNYAVGAGVAQDKSLALDQHLAAARSLSDVDAWTAAMLGRDNVTPGRPTIDDPARPWDRGQLDIAAMSDEDIAADVAAMMAAARPLTAIEGTP